MLSQVQSNDELDLEGLTVGIINEVHKFRTLDAMSDYILSTGPKIASFYVEDGVWSLVVYQVSV